MLLVGTVVLIVVIGHLEVTRRGQNRIQIEGLKFELNSNFNGNKFKFSI